MNGSKIGEQSAMRIMLVDPHLVSARNLSERLLKMGYECDVFESPDEALSVLESEPAEYGPVLIDYSCGPEVLRRCCEIGARIMVMSDRVISRSDLGLIRSCAEYFISKPVDTDELRAAVERRNVRVES